MQPKCPIYWYQGLFLQPQHLQQFDLYVQSLLTPFSEYLQPYFWGVCAIEVDEDLLKNFSFSLKIGEFIFQDGTWVVLNKNAEATPRSFQEKWSRVKEAFTVYVGLKNISSAGNNLSERGEARYTANERELEFCDLFHKDKTAIVETLKYSVKFVWDDELDLHSDYFLIPIAKVEYDGQNAFVSNEYVPPLITISASAVISRYFNNLLEMLTSRMNVLSTYKNPRGFLQSELQPFYFNFLFALRTINPYVAMLKHLSEVKHIHPWQLYGILRALVAELSIFTDRIDAMGKTDTGQLLVPSYDHQNILNCFRQVYILIDEILEELLRGLESVVHLRRENDYFKGEIPSKLLSDANFYYLGIKTSYPREELIEKVHQIVKVGSEEDMPVLINRALSGVPLTHLQELPFGLPRRAGMLYFEIDKSSKYWKSIAEHRNINIYWIDAPEDVLIDLIILKH